MEFLRLEMKDGKSSGLFVVVREKANSCNPSADLWKERSVANALMGGSE